MESNIFQLPDNVEFAQLLCIDVFSTADRISELKASGWEFVVNKTDLITYWRPHEVVKKIAYSKITFNRKFLTKNVLGPKTQIAFIQKSCIFELVCPIVHVDIQGLIFFNT